VVASNNNNDTTTTTVAVGVNPTTTTTTTLAPVTTTTTTLPSTNHAPFAVLNVNPDPPNGQGPLTVTFDLCKSTDPDKDGLSYFFNFGDGTKASGSCVESHTYSANFRAADNVHAQDRSYTAEACVVDPGNLSACRSRNVNVTSPPPACPGAPTIVLSPPPSFTGCGDLPVQATANNADTVTFCAESVPFGSCSPGLKSTSAPGPNCVPGTASGNVFSANLPLFFSCNQVTASAKSCGGTVNSTAYFTFAGCGFSGEAAGPSRERSAYWSSDLTVEGGRLQVVVNGASPVFPERGRSFGTSSLVNGENRIEAVLVESAGKAGLWRIDFNPSESIADGSLRVISGEVVLLGASSATFRLTGREGERIVFTFLKK